MKISNIKKFDMIRKRVADMSESHAERIKKGEFAWITCSIFSEMDWLCKEVERLAGAKATVEDEEDELVEV